MPAKALRSGRSARRLHRTGSPTVLRRRFLSPCRSVRATPSAGTPGAVRSRRADPGDVEQRTRRDDSRDAVRRRQIRAVGANRWRDPEGDLPADFKGNGDVHAALGRPQDAGEFITALQTRHCTSLECLEQASAEGTTRGVAIVTPTPLSSGLVGQGSLHHRPGTCSAWKVLSASPRTGCT